MEEDEATMLAMNARNPAVSEASNLDVTHSEAAAQLDSEALTEKIEDLSTESQQELAELLDIEAEPTALAEELIATVEDRGAMGIGVLQSDALSRLRDLGDFLGNLKARVEQLEDEVVGN